MKIETSHSLCEFFRNQVAEAQAHQKLELGHLTLVYVVDLLERAALGTEIFKQGESKPFDEPLALLFGRAMEAQSLMDQIDLLRFIGDRSLYVSGFFSDSLNRKAVDMNYYIAMGETAYSQASSLLRLRPKQRGTVGVFAELSEKFRRVVDILAEISEAAGYTSDENLLRIYERWLSTKSPRLHEKLQSLGLIPCDVPEGKLH